MPVGTAAYPVPSNALIVAPNGSDANAGTLAAPMRTVKAAVARASFGQTIVLRAGTYNEGFMINSGKDVTIQNYPDEAVWFDGSIPVTDWVQQGSTWVASGWTAQFDHSASYTTGSDAGGWVNPSYPMAAYPDQVFVDGAQLDQVASGQTPGPGQFAVDYSQHTLTIGTDPSGHELRASNLSSAFVVAGRLTLRGVGVRRYATPMPQIGTIFFGGSTGGDVVENVVVKDNATQGIGLGVQGCTLNHVTSVYNGLMGVAANTASNSIVENSVLSFNNTQHFNPAPSAGGIKIARSDHFVVRDNDVIDNAGVNGIWTDVTTTNFTIVHNTVIVDHGPYGILSELSDTGVVAGNSVIGAKYGYTAFDTGNVKVFNNVFSNNSVWDIGLSQDERRNTDSRTSTVCPWLVRNVIVSDNVLGSNAAFQFYALDKASGTPASSMNITVAGNFFPTNSTRPVMVGWGGGDNLTVTYYRTPSALDSGLGVDWHNAAATLDNSVNGSAQTFATPLPSDVATALDAPVGTTRVGVI
ncbi:MAG TPA: right-handed parallel beta-helix repeat-containing protein [Jatrophihabitans sp.]|jgi:hypothetical protein